MADFNQNLNSILNSVYGKDVRRAIYDALVQLGNNQGTGSGSGSVSAGAYTLPVASANTLGGVKIGSDFSITSDGKISIANNKVVRKDGYTDNDVGTFLFVDSNKKIVTVPIRGQLFDFAYDDNGKFAGLEFSTTGRLWLTTFIGTILNNSNTGVTGVYYTPSISDITGGFRITFTPSDPDMEKIHKDIVYSQNTGSTGDGTPGGYYTPAVQQLNYDTLEISFTPSDSDMPAVDPIYITLPEGADGADGGYYTPSVTQSSDGKELTFKFSGSVAALPNLAPIKITLPAGGTGDGTPGGYYIPVVQQLNADTFKLSFTPSSEVMPEVESIQMTLPAAKADMNEVVESLNIIDGGNAFTSNYGASISSRIKWSCIGDSITDLRTNRPNNYPYWVKYNNPTLSVQNLGIGGAFICFDRDDKLSDGSPINSLYTQAKSIDSDTDIITVFGGVNDYNWGVPLGTFTTDLTGYPTSKVITGGSGVPSGGTFYQGVYRLAKYLRETFPDKPIVWFTPMTFGVGSSSNKDVQNKNGNTIYQFMDAVKEVTGYFSMPCYDMGRLCSINPRIKAMQDKYYLDTLHPNAAGSLILSRIIEREMKKTLLEWGVNL